MTNNRAIGTRKSNFNALTTVDPTATMDFVLNGVNYKITFADFLAALGVSGTIEQLGGVGDTPVLNIAASVNQIRNLAEGFGITLNIEPSGSISIAMAYTFDETGAVLVDDPAAAVPVFRSLVEGADVVLTESDGQIEIALDPSDVKPENRVIVNEAADFPTAVGGVITLAASTQYLIGAAIDVGSDRFHLSTNSNMRGLVAASSITSSTTGALFTAADAGLIGFIELTVSAPNASLLNVTDTAQGNTFVFAINSILLELDSIGTVNNINTLTLTNAAFLSLNDGVTFGGTIDVISVRQAVLNSADTGFKAIDFGSAVVTSVDARDLIITAPAGAYGISGLANNGNIVSGSIAQVESCEFLGGMTPLETITVDDYRWRFIGNSGLKDTTPDALLSMNNNSTETVIGAANTPVLVAGTWAAQRESHFSGTTAGRATYDGEQGLTVPIDVSLSFEPASGSNKDIAVYIAINGTEVTETGIVRLTDSGDPGAASTLWQYDLSQNDYIEVFVENRTDTVNIVVNDVILRVR